jgi:hypothetical protein
VKKILIALVALMLITTPVLAQDSTDDVLKSIEEERTEKLEEALLLTLPTVSDNPSHIINFKDPSDKGVQLEIDGQGFSKITSPHTLPSLGIGEHTLTFRFTDSEETVQNLEKSLTIVPRPPVINAPSTISSTMIVLSGKALVGSTVDLHITGETLNESAQAEVDDSGEWDFTFEGEYPNAIYTVIGIVTKDGFGSTYSEPVVFELSEKGNIIESTTSGISFAFAKLNTSTLVDDLKSNPDLLWFALAAFTLGMLVHFLLNMLLSSRESRDITGMFRDTLNRNGGKKEAMKSDDGKELTLREKFEKAGYATNKPNGKKVEKKKVDEPKSGILGFLGKKKTKSISKDRFMEEFKEVDPDDSKGKENTPKPKSKEKDKDDVMKNDVKIDLTSTPKEE